MNWTIFGRIADILAVASFIISLGIFRKIIEKSQEQKERYSEEREKLLSSLSALQDSIWRDGLKSIKIQDNLQTLVYEYQQKYWLKSSPQCWFHTIRCIHILNLGISESNMPKIRQDINFLMARLTKKE